MSAAAKGSEIWATIPHSSRETQVLSLDRNSPTKPRPQPLTGGFQTNTVLLSPSPRHPVLIFQLGGWGKSPLVKSTHWSPKAFVCMSHHRQGSCQEMGFSFL